MAQFTIRVILDDPEGYAALAQAIGEHLKAWRIPEDRYDSYIALMMHTETVFDRDVCYIRVTPTFPGLLAPRIF